MKKKHFFLTFLLVLLICAIPNPALAAYNPPTIFGAPEDVAVEYRETSEEEDWDGFNITISASDEIRAYVDEVQADNSPFEAADYNWNGIILQMDYKVDNGSWHYQSEWDEKYDDNSNTCSVRIEKGTYSNYGILAKAQFEGISAGEALPDKKAFFDNHSMDIRIRFIVSYQDSDGTYYKYFSPWSETVSFSNNQKIEDPAALINHVPVLKSAELKTYPDGRPYLNIITDKAHEDLRKLNSISGNEVETEVWLKAGTGGWEMCGSEDFVEEFNVGAEAYAGLKDNYEAANYEIKYRYIFDYFNYPAAGKSGKIYSPFSNIISKGMPAYSAVSSYAKSDIDKADGLGLIPASLKGTDLTKPITREEFTELTLVLYEKSTGIKTTPVSPNPFTDTDNPEILKAYKAGIAKGMSATTYKPNDLINREQVAAILLRAIKVMAPNGNYSSVGAPIFKDQKEISDWALESVLVISRMGIIAGSDGKFMPRATTTVQQAAKYGSTTREQAILMSLRTMNKMEGIKAGT